MFWRIRRCSSFKGLKGFKRSLFAPALIVTFSILSISIDCAKLNVWRITPIEPVIVVGSAMMRSAADDT